MYPRLFKKKLALDADGWFVDFVSTQVYWVGFEMRMCIDMYHIWLMMTHHAMHDMTSLAILFGRVI